MFELLGVQPSVGLFAAEGWLLLVSSAIQSDRFIGGLLAEPKVVAPTTARLVAKREIVLLLLCVHANGILLNSQCDNNNSDGGSWK